VYITIVLSTDTQSWHDCDAFEPPNSSAQPDLIDMPFKVCGQSFLRLNCTLEDQPQSCIDQGRVLPFRDSRFKTPTHFKTLIALGSSAPRPGAPFRNFMVYDVTSVNLSVPYARISIQDGYLQPLAAGCFIDAKWVVHSKVGDSNPR
jgi:hypothetical protein